MSFTTAEYSHLWYTPAEWLEWVRETFGQDYHDPCPQDWDGTDGLLWCTDQPTYVNHPGGRGQFDKWHQAFYNHVQLFRGIWCGFNLSQLRLAAKAGRSFFEMSGYLILPHERVKYVWGGPTLYKRPNGEITENAFQTSLGQKPVKLFRKHGQPMPSPAHDSFFWSTTEPAVTPVNCSIVRTGR